MKAEFAPTLLAAGGSEICGSDGWFSAEDRAALQEWRARSQRRHAYEEHARALCEELKVALAGAIASHNRDAASSVPLQCGDSPSGGFSVTRFAHPLATLDVLIDVESGMIASISTSSAERGYRERLRVLLMRSGDPHVTLFDDQGRHLTSVDGAVHEILRPFFAQLDAPARGAPHVEGLLLTRPAYP